ncbi:hypothetical protein [Streptomyces ziwulingensis]|uniref:Uncharacterized protein n=1 Tax=Streptomyces ziwulingensis TaxID=1045501 RepID=A0ABP9AXI4_9ACTN
MTTEQTTTEPTAIEQTTTERAATDTSGAPPVPAFAPGAVPEPAPAVRKERPRPRAVLRWAAAALVFAAVGSATAYGVTGLERTDVPGLATASDGRWDYPALTRPPLPSGSPGPFAQANPAGTHHADLRALVLPAPEGAAPDKALRGADGWLATKDFLAEYAKDEREELRQKFTDAGLRHIAARGWRTGDGTHTRIYLLQFDTAVVVDRMFVSDLAPASGPAYSVRGAESSVYDEDFPDSAVPTDLGHSVYVEPAPYGAEQVRQGYLAAGDVLALVTQSREGAARAVPFQQTVVLQSQLLG